jgi:hypothetical protein
VSLSPVGPHDSGLVSELGPEGEKGDIVREKDVEMEGQVEDFVQYWLSERHAHESAYKSSVTTFPDVNVVLTPRKYR